MQDINKRCLGQQGIQEHEICLEKSEMCPFIKREWGPLMCQEIYNKCLDFIPPERRKDSRRISFLWMWEISVTIILLKGDFSNYVYVYMS